MRALSGDVGIAAVILISDHEYVSEDRVARRVCEDPAPANCYPETYGDGFWPRVGARVGQLCPVRLRRDHAGPLGARGRVRAWPAAGYGLVAAGGPGGEG